MSAIASWPLAVRAGRRFVVLAVCSVLMACGAGADEPSLTAGQAAELQRSITAARGGAERSDRGAVRAALERFRRDVRRLAATGALSEDRAQALLAGAGQAQRRVEVDIMPVASRGDVPGDGRDEQRDEERLEDEKDEKDDKEQQKQKEKEKEKKEKEKDDDDD